MADETIEKAGGAQPNAADAGARNGAGNTDDKKNKKNKKTGGKKGKKKIIVIAIIIIALIAAGLSVFTIRRKKLNSANQDVMVSVERRNIQNTVTGSSVVEPNDSYNVSSMVTGEVLSDYFSEGDLVKKDQVLYNIEATTAQNNVDSAKNSLRKAQLSYDDAIYNNAASSTAILKAKDTLLKAQEDLADVVRGLDSNDRAIQQAANSVSKSQNAYKTAADAMEDLDVKAECNGTVKTVYVSNGDNVANGTKIAEVYDSTYMKLVVPFNTGDAANIMNGSAAQIKVSGQNGLLYGTVTGVSSAEVATDAHAIVRYVTIELANPGALTINDKGSATINGILCQDVANFEYIDTKTITAKTAGEIFSLNIQENDRVWEDTVVANLSSDNVETSLANAEIDLDNANLSLQDAILKNDEVAKNNSVKNAQRTLEEAKASYDSTVRSQGQTVKNAALELSNAKLALEKANDTLDDYNIKAPIEGTVVTKNVKAGDKLENSSQNSNTGDMAVIYDLTCLKFELAIDETEIQLVKVGQEVDITADAVEGTFKGVITKVGVDGTSATGVTTYPVEVRIDDYGDLLPGMNIDASIVVESAEDTLAIPLAALNRGNIVYIKGEKTDETDKAPEGYKSVKVETGINDSVFIEIKSGLNEGDNVKGANQATGNDTTGAATSMQMGGMPGGMGGGMPGGGMPGGGMGGGMSGGNRGGGMR